MTASLRPPPADTVAERLLAERIVYLAGPVDDAAAHRVNTHLLVLAADDPDRDVTLYVHCPGGSVTAGLAIHDTMRLVAPDVVTWAVGLAAGTAQFLVTAGAPGKRYALPHARLLVQRPGPAGDVAVTAELFGALKREFAELTAGYTGRTVEEVLADAERGRWFDAEQARAYGLVDHVAGRSGAPEPSRRIGFSGGGRGNTPA